MAKFQSPLLGYNNNVRHKNRVFHIQTEDSGVNHPHIITHLFMDGGRILKSVKRSYAEHVGTEGMNETVRGLMKEQHKAMFIALREGQFDHLLDGGSSASAKAQSEGAAKKTSSGAMAAQPSPRTASSDANASAPEASPDAASAGASETDARTQAEAQAKTEPHAKAEADAKPDADAKTEAADADAKTTDAKTEAQAKADADAKTTDAKTEAQAKADADAKSTDANEPVAPHAAAHASTKGAPSLSDAPAHGGEPMAPPPSRSTRSRPPAPHASSRPMRAASPPPSASTAAAALAAMDDAPPTTKQIDAPPSSRDGRPPQSARELTLDFDALERASDERSPAFSNNDLPPPPQNLFTKERGTAAYRVLDAEARHEHRDPRAEPPSNPSERAAVPVLRRPSHPPSDPRYAAARPASVFSSTQRPPPASIFSDDLVSDKSLDEVILSYLAEDLEPPRRK